MKITSASSSVPGAGSGSCETTIDGRGGEGDGGGDWRGRERFKVTSGGRGVGSFEVSGGRK